MVLLATAATVIASQAVITGAYSVASQAAQLGYLPRLRITHTSESTGGQIYVPWINWLLMVSVLTLVFAFRSSMALAYAFGMAVTGTITITTLLFFYVARLKWHTPLWLLGIGAFLLLGVDLLFVAANLTKLVHGAWLPLLIGLTAFTVMTTWQRGREIVTAERERREGPLPEFVERLRNNKALIRPVPGTAVFLNRGKQTAPLALRANLEHNHIRHQHVVILSIETEPVPRLPDHERVTIDDLRYADDGITHVTARFGYMETPDIPTVLKTLGPGHDRGPAAARGDVLLPVNDRAAARQGADNGALAQTAIHSHLLHHRRRRRALRAPPRPHRHHGLSHQRVTAHPTRTVSSAEPEPFDWAHP